VYQYSIGTKTPLLLSKTLKRHDIEIIPLV